MRICNIKWDVRVNKEIKGNEKKEKEKIEKKTRKENQKRKIEKKQKNEY